MRLEVGERVHSGLRTERSYSRLCRSFLAALCFRWCEDRDAGSSRTTDISDTVVSLRRSRLPLSTLRGTLGMPRGSSIIIPSQVVSRPSAGRVVCVDAASKNQSQQFRTRTIEQTVDTSGEGACRPNERLKREGIHTSVALGGGEERGGQYVAMRWSSSARPCPIVSFSASC